MDNQNNTPNTPNTEGKTFTQDDVNRIVQERLSKERERGTAELAQREKDLAAREMALTAREKLTENGLPVELLEALNCSSVEALDKSIALLKEHALKKQPAEKLMGFVPGDSHVDTGYTHRGEAGWGDDYSIRKAMGLK